MEELINEYLDRYYYIEIIHHGRRVRIISATTHNEISISNILYELDCIFSLDYYNTHTSLYDWMKKLKT